MKQEYIDELKLISNWASKRIEEELQGGRGLQQSWNACIWTLMRINQELDRIVKEIKDEKENTSQPGSLTT